MTGWRDHFSAVAREHLPADIAQRWIELLRPAARLVPYGTGQQVGQLGGNPSLPSDLAWPEFYDQGPLTFIAGVDCSALPREAIDIPLPASGSLLFFYFDGRYHPGEGIPYFDPANPDWVTGTRVLYVPAGVPVSERPAPQGLRPYPRVPLSAEVMASAPGPEHPALTQVQPGYAVSLAEAAEDLEVEDETGRYVFEAVHDFARPDGPAHRIGGFADPVQDTAWVLLAQIDSQEFEGDEMIWGNRGSLYWLIRRDDLAEGRFDRTRFMMQCG